MNSKNENWFFYSAVAMLFLTAAAKLYSAGADTKILATVDQLSRLGCRPLMISVALVEIAVAVFLLKSQSSVRRSLVLLWLSGNFTAYRLGNYLLGIHNCPCLGNLADRLPLRRGLADTILQAILLYWLLGSLTLFWQDWGAEHWARLALGYRGLFRRSSAPAHPS